MEVDRFSSTSLERRPSKRKVSSQLDMTDEVDSLIEGRLDELTPWRDGMVPSVFAIGIRSKRGRTTVPDPRRQQPAHRFRDREERHAGRADSRGALQRARQVGIRGPAMGMRQSLGLLGSPIGILAGPIPSGRPCGSLQPVGVRICRRSIRRPRGFRALEPRKLPCRHAGVGFGGGRLAITTFGVLNSHRGTQRRSSPGKRL